ncbi:hypothetical protein J1605_021583 [Eschrichtius robustus]|uniref:Tribbles homolog 2 n=1 Tax=Eschrichtius robustus TaxID=9764 RepID=A0AB34HGI4_ESCRO|nr:hypothetical protein J1605_021583 [Eschrichtius robustus]
MNIHRSTPITIARYGRSRNKTQDFEELSSIRSAEPSQSFSPNLGSPSPPETPNLSHCVSCIGRYLLLEPLEGDHVFRAVHLHSGEELVCKVFDISCYQESLAPCFCLSAHSNINQITEIILGETKAYVFFERSYGDMHSFVRTCKKLKEEEAARLFYQIASAVAHCHDGGLVLRDLKLRKFIFKDEESMSEHLSPSSPASRRTIGGKESSPCHGRGNRAAQELGDLAQGLTTSPMMELA